MKKLNYKAIAILFTLAVFATGCSKDWLELELTGKVPFSSETIETEAEAMELLAAAYDLLQVKYYAGWSSYYLLSNLPSDDCVPVGGGFSDRPEYWDIHQFNTTTENPALLQLWRRNYYGIYRANIVINEVGLESNQMNKMRAEAKFLRAYYYFELVRAFGDVAFYTENLAPSEYNISNTEKAVIYAQMEQDLLEAIEVLPKKSEQSRAQYTRASKGAAQALLGKVYLYQEKYTEAASVLEDVIASNEYSLLPIYDSIFVHNYEYGVESVFEIPYSNYLHGDFWANGRESEGNIDVQLTGSRETAIGDLYLGGWGFDMIDSSLIDAFDAQGDDIRKYATGFGPELFKEMLDVDPAKDVNNNGYPDDKEKEGWTGWYQKKRATYPSAKDPSQGDSSWENNEKMIRYSDVLLMCAEALNQSGNDSKALEYINMVRNRVNLDDLTGLSGNALFDAIKAERRLEFGMEGHRFWDLVRWGDAPSVLGAAGFVEGKHEIFPIPEAEIGKTSLVQNPGY